MNIHEALAQVRERHGQDSYVRETHGRGKVECEIYTHLGRLVGWGASWEEALEMDRRKARRERCACGRYPWGTRVGLEGHWGQICHLNSGVVHRERETA